MVVHADWNSGQGKREELCGLLKSGLLSPLRLIGHGVEARTGLKKCTKDFTLFGYLHVGLGAESEGNLFQDGDCLCNKCNKFLQVHIIRQHPSTEGWRKAFGAVIS